MTYFDTITSNVNTILKRLDELIKHLENEYKKTPTKKNSIIIRKYANEIFDKIEKVEFLKMRLNNFLNHIKYIADYDLGNININQIKTVSSILKKMNQVIENTKDNDKLIKFINKISEKMKNVYCEEKNDNSIIELSIEEIHNLKIGALGRYILKRLSYINKFTEIDIKNMQNKDWCKNVLKLQNPLIKKLIEGQDELEQRKVNGSDKYYQMTILIRGKRFFISKELYEQSRESLIKWYKIKNDILQDIDAEFLGYNSENNNVKDIQPIIEEEIDELKQEYFSDPFKILNWLDNSEQK